MEIKATRYTVPERAARDRAAKARKARIEGLSITARRRGCTAGNGGDCPFCTGSLTFSRNVPAHVDIREQVDLVSFGPEPEAWTYYDTAATFYGKWDYEQARNDREFAVTQTWQAWEADNDTYFWSIMAEDSGIRWEQVWGKAWTHSVETYERELWDDFC